MGSSRDPIVRSFVDVVTKKVSPCKIILFGSRATGKARKDSDYDFLVISPKFKKIEWEERSAQMYFLKRNIPAAMDIICLTPEEVEAKRKEIGIIRDVIKEGKVVADT